MRSYRAPLVALLCLSPTAVEATILANWSLDEIAAHADAVVIGTVGAQRLVETPGGTWWTETELRVERQLKGEART